MLDVDGGLIAPPPPPGPAGSVGIEGVVLPAPPAPPPAPPPVGPAADGEAVGMGGSNGLWSPILGPEAHRAGLTMVPPTQPLEGLQRAPGRGAPRARSAATLPYITPKDPGVLAAAILVDDSSVVHKGKESLLSP